MKYLSDYVEDSNSKTFKKYDAFFAFSKEQLKIGMLENGHTDKKNLCSLRSGLICRKADSMALSSELSDNYLKAVSQDKADNKAIGIIRRELANFEFCITGDLSDAQGALASYNFTEEQYKEGIKEYLENCDY